ncbi:MAG TPA: efflux RND transporter periplasmic adaptor subunit [Terriglobales bacterium]|nr:efflux RND transporter periplasmic adaptor subunit [Terriglobales bacterium]
MANNYNGQGSGSGRRWAVIAGAVFIIAVAAGLFQLLRPLRIRVSTTEPTRENIQSTITTNGKIEPVKNFEAHATAPSTVRNVLVHPGQRVHKGQLLVQLDDSDARTQLAKALAMLKQAQSETSDVQTANASSQAELTKAKLDAAEAQRSLEALQRLRSQGAASQAEVDAAKDRLDTANASLAALQHKANPQAAQARTASSQAAIANAQVAVNAARQLIADSNITSPFDGTVYSLTVRPGNYVSAGDPVVSVADLSHMQVLTFVDEPEIGHLKVGESATVTWDALPGRIWKGEVATVPTTVVARGNRNVGELLTTVDNADRTLIPNTNVGVVITTSSRQNALVLPREAVHEEGGADYIYVVQDKHLQRRAVKLGVSNLTHVEILSGLKEGETVAVNSLSPAPLTDGVSVRVMERS